MRLALATLVLVVAALASGFDHRIHGRDVDVAGKDPIPCTRCHKLEKGVLVGRPDHAACYGDCHGAPPAKPRRGDKLTIPPERALQCAACHADTVLAQPFTGKLPATYPPYVPDDFAIELGHKRHREVACATCHAAKPTKAAPHRRCLGCHDGSGANGRGPAMTACAGCHTPGGGTPQPPSLAEPINTVSATFSHPAHAARGGAGALCTTCHAELRDTDDSILPRPTVKACAIAGCHDNKPVFGVTVACTRCHTTAPARYEVERKFEFRYRHTAEHHATANLPCASCHPLGKTGEVLVSGHAPCATCHADEFGLRTPRICFACHNTTDPWRPLVADRLPPERTEFGATLDHDKHPGACAACHSLRTPRAQLRPPRGHRACTTAGCHAVSGGPAPQLTACESCHQLGLAERRIAERSTAAWSVRATFDHAPHAKARDGSALACTSCHGDLSGPSVSALRAPPKQACVACHDGTIAFKVTGTGCTRCHPGSAR